MKKIVICGPMKFKDTMIEQQYKISLLGHDVSMPTFRPDGMVAPTEDEKKKMLDLHKRKIREADEVYIINNDNYMGEDTVDELIYAARMGKPIQFYTWPRIFNDEQAVRQDGIAQRPMFPPARSGGVNNEY